VGEQRGADGLHQLAGRSGGAGAEQVLHGDAEAAGELLEHAQGQVAGVGASLDPLDGERVDAGAVARRRWDRPRSVRMRRSASGSITAGSPR
jgi:hypothetical protein